MIYPTALGKYQLYFCAGQTYRSEPRGKSHPTTSNTVLHIDAPTIGERVVFAVVTKRLFIPTILTDTQHAHQTNQKIISSKPLHFLLPEINHPVSYISNCRCKYFAFIYIIDIPVCI
jgi:hypothetical protein